MSGILEQTRKRFSDRLVDLIDILFAVVVGTSISTAFANNPIQRLPSLYEVITLPNMSLIIAYAAVILSWVGYHRMMEVNPYTPNRWGYSRFGIDVVIVFVYTFLIYSREIFSIFLFIFPIIFLLYAFGGIIRNKEYKKRVSWPKVSLKYTFLFLLDWGIYFAWDSLRPSYAFLESIPTSWILCFLTLACLFYYRWQREKRGFLMRA